MLSNENGICIFKATVGYTDEEGEFRPLGTGTAYEKEGANFINKTSYIENCETSAVGRALGMCGFGIEVSVASAEEVQNAINNQTEPKATAKQISMIENLYNDDEITAILEKIGSKDRTLEDLTVSQASALISKRKG